MRSTARLCRLQEHAHLRKRAEVPRQRGGGQRAIANLGLPPGGAGVTAVVRNNMWGAGFASNCNAVPPQFSRLRCCSQRQRLRPCAPAVLRAPDARARRRTPPTRPRAGRPPQRPRARHRRPALPQHAASPSRAAAPPARTAGTVAAPCSGAGEPHRSPPTRRSTRTLHHPPPPPQAARQAAHRLLPLLPYRCCRCLTQSPAAWQPKPRRRHQTAQPHATRPAPQPRPRPCRPPVAPAAEAAWSRPRRTSTLPAPGTRAPAAPLLRAPRCAACLCQPRRRSRQKHPGVPPHRRRRPCQADPHPPRVHAWQRFWGLSVMGLAAEPRPLRDGGAAVLHRPVGLPLAVQHRLLQPPASRQLPPPRAGEVLPAAARLQPA